MAKKKQKQKQSGKGSKPSEEKRRRSVPGTGRSWFAKHKLVIALLALTGIAMGPVAFNDFVSLDDTLFITENRVVQEGDVHRALTKQLYSPHYKPLVYLGWIAEVGIAGNNPYLLHANNLLLHLGSTLLLFFCVLRIAAFWPYTRAHDKAIAFFSALLFGIHPLHVESVAWAIERKDVLFGIFYIGGMLCYLKFLDGRRTKYLYFTAILYLLTLLSKSMGITLIAMTFLMDYASGRRDWKKMITEKWVLCIPFVIALYLYGFIYHPRGGGGGGSDISGFGDGAVKPPENIAGLPAFYQQILIAFVRYLFFFFHTLVPSKLALVYPREAILGSFGALIHLAVAGVGLIASLPWLLRKYRDFILTGILFFTIGLVPILVEEGPGTNFGSDRYTYIPSIGLLMLLTTLLCNLWQRNVTGNISLGKLILGGISAVFGIATFFQAARWGSSFELYDQAVKNYRGNAVALHYRGGANEDINADAAIADYSASIEIDPVRFRPWFARGTLYLKLLKYREAIEDMTTTLELNPRYEKAWVNRGNAYRDLGENDLAIADYNEALKINRRFDKALNNRGAAYLKKGLFDAALEDFNKVLEIDPAYVNGYINRAALYINPGVQKYELAIQDYDRALTLDPANVQARYFRGIAWRGLGRNAEALQDVDMAIAMSPGNAAYHYSRAQILRSLGRHAESVQSARKAQSMGHNVPAEYLQ